MIANCKKTGFWEGITLCSVFVKLHYRDLRDFINSIQLKSLQIVLVFC